VRAVEELAVCGVIDAETYIELSDALIAGTTTVRDCFSLLDARTCERIRARAAQIWRQGRLEAAETEGSIEPTATTFRVDKSQRHNLRECPGLLRR
jgi:hypothetical protein